MKIIESSVGQIDKSIPTVTKHPFGFEEYFEYKRKVMHEFGIHDESKLARLKVGGFKTEAECDRYCRTLIMGV